MLNRPCRQKTHAKKAYHNVAKNGLSDARKRRCAAKTLHTSASETNSIEFSVLALLTCFLGLFAAYISTPDDHVLKDHLTSTLYYSAGAFYILGVLYVCGAPVTTSRALQRLVAKATVLFLVLCVVSVGSYVSGVSGTDVAVYASASKAWQERILQKNGELQDLNKITEARLSEYSACTRQRDAISIDLRTRRVEGAELKRAVQSAGSELAIFCKLERERLEAVRQARLDAVASLKTALSEQPTPDN
jgi:hypothetical protein